MSVTGFFESYSAENEWCASACDSPTRPRAINTIPTNDGHAVLLFLFADNVIRILFVVANAFEQLGVRLQSEMVRSR